MTHLKKANLTVFFNSCYKMIPICNGEGGTYPLAHFLGNFREKTKKVPTRTVSWKLTEIS